MVVNATLAAMAKHGQSKEPGMHVYHIASSVVNPLVFQDLGRAVYKHFSASPLLDSKGKPIVVRQIKFFSDMDKFMSYIRNDAIQRAGNVLKGASHEKLSQRLERIFMKSVEQGKYLANIYEPYTFYGGR